MDRGRLGDAQSQPVEPCRRHRRVRAGRRGAGEAGDRRCRESVSGLGDGLDPGACEQPRQDRIGDPGPQGRAGATAFARGRQDAARRCGRGHARRADLSLFRGRSRSRIRREAAVDPARCRDRSHTRADRRHRHHHPVEFSDRDSRVEDRARAGVWQHGRVQARGLRSRLRLGAGGHHCACGAPARRVQPRHGSRLGGRGDDGQSSFGCRDQLHRLGLDRPRHRRQGDRPHGEAAARDGRQESAGRARRCRLGDRDQRRGPGCVLFDRPALHRVLATDRHTR